MRLHFAYAAFAPHILFLQRLGCTYQRCVSCTCTCTYLVLLTRAVYLIMSLVRRPECDNRRWNLFWAPSRNSCESLSRSQIQIHTHTHTHTQQHRHPYAHTRTHTHSHTHTFTQTHGHTVTHSRVQTKQKRQTERRRAAKRQTNQRRGEFEMKRGRETKSKGAP